MADPQDSMNARVNTPAAAPPGEFNIQHPTPTPGYQAPGNPAPAIAAPGFTPRDGEGNAAARTRVIDAVLQIAAANGQSPARNG